MKHQLHLSTNRLVLLVLAAAFLFLTGSRGFAQNDTGSQDDTGSRSITSEDFSSRRPPAKKGIGIKAEIGRVSYKLVVRQKAPVRRPAVSARPKKTRVITGTITAPVFSEVGVTLWRMREPRRTDTGAKLPVRKPDGSRALWTPERVNAETAFRPGDRVRIAVESSGTGYLYVVDTETYADGSFGEPYLIFPEGRNDDNAVRPGMLVDIPDQAEDLPYFLINPKGKNYTGELLTVIISPVPLTGLQTDQEGLITNLDELLDLEAGVDVEIYSRTDSQNEIFTQAEADSACGSKSRQLVREKTNAEACGTQNRQLTREEPLPQSIYRVKAPTGRPAVAFVRLMLGR